MDRKPFRIKLSYGIACCRRNKDGIPEILLIQKSNTYAFVVFVLECDSLNEDRVRRLFNEMTRYEKLEILKMDYEKLWKRICSSVPETNHESKNIIESYSTYMKKKTYFETTYMSKQLRRLMKGTYNIETSWDIPKGRRCTPEEKDLDVAIRELQEETTAPIGKFNIFMHARPVVQSYIDGTRKYINTYFLAESEDRSWCPKLDIFEDEYTESRSIRWFSMEELRAIEKNSRYHKRLINIVNVILKHFKKLRSS